MTNAKDAIIFWDLVLGALFGIGAWDLYPPSLDRIIVLERARMLEPHVDRLARLKGQFLEAVSREGGLDQDVVIGAAQ